jgi:hypothetical protein
MNHPFQLFLLLIVQSAAFNPIEGLTSIRNIVNSRAVLTTVSDKFAGEFIGENVMLYELSSARHNIPLDILYTALCFGSFYSQFKYVSFFENKWRNVPQYTKMQDKTKLVLFVLATVFTKNIQNAI